MRDTLRMTEAEVSLECWIEQHGPLSPSAALLIGLDTLALASAMSPRQLAATIASLHPSRITRREGNGWRWTPGGETETSRSPRVGDHQIVERIGALLFYALTGEPVRDPLVGAPALRARLHSLRPDLASSIADLTVRATLVRHSHHRLTPSALARELRRPLAADGDGGTPRSVGTRLMVISALVGMAGLLWFAARPGDRLATHGLTRDETTLTDIYTEASETFAVIDEHTASLLLHQQLRRLWGPQVHPDDARLMSMAVHEAWVRTLARDFLTAEQLLSNAPRGFLREFGERHPYTRGARLALAAVLEKRGAISEAAALKADAERTTRELLEDARRLADVAPDVPIGPGVVAHMAPSVPEREGFRQAADGFEAPLTSVQRLVAGRSGWRLHVVAREACHVSVDVGAVPRRVTLKVAPMPDRSWQVDVAGVTPVVTLRQEPAPSVKLAIVAGAAGDLEAKLGETIRRSQIDTAGPLPDPPYALAFRGASAASACALVWMELAFPFGPTSQIP